MGDMTTTTDEQYRQVYEGIVAVASRCDGAQTKDRVGFNGQDTHFGRRISSVPFSEWTDAVRQEAARISLTYKVQIESYTGVDVSTLDVVREAADLGTNHTARNDARGYERKAKGQALRAHRKATLLDDGRIQMTWHAKDDECFGILLTEVRALPGRRWTGGANVVDFTPEAVDFIERHCLDVDFDLAMARAEATLVAAEPKYDIVLDGDRARISFAYDPAKVAAVRSLPGRQYDGSTKTNTADLSQALLAFAAEHGLAVHPAVTSAVEARSEAIKVEETTESLLAIVSRSADPAALPEEFVNRVLEVLA